MLPGKWNIKPRSSFMAFIMMALINTNSSSRSGSTTVVKDSMALENLGPPVPPTTSAVLMTNEMVISTQPRNFNKNSSEQQQHQVLLEQKEHPNTCLDCLSSSSKQTPTGAAPFTPTTTITPFALITAATARGNIVSINGNAIAADETHNVFHADDQINTSNQRHDFNARQRRAATTATVATDSASKSTTSTTATPLDAVDNVSTFFERVELQESLTQHQHQKLLHHRRKRYLAFPEGSSFQLVFDLIIPIVDYTYFAIMGITCAVAWELPSKPPSELIENLRDKLQEGAYGHIRRNDSTLEDIKYVDVESGDGGFVNEDTVAADGGGLYYQKPNRVPATVDKYENDERKSMVPPNTYTHNYTNDYHHKQPVATAWSPKGSHSYYRQPQPARNYFVDGDNFVKVNDDKSRWRSKYEQAPGGVVGYQHTLSSHPGMFAKYSKNKNGISSAAGYASRDKQKYADWQQQRPGSAARNDDDGFAGAAHGKQPWRYGNYARWSEDNWWQRKQQRVQSKWRGWKGGASKQRAKPVFKDKASSYSNKFSSIASSTSARTGRQRKILQSSPKHRIYPVFARRRRRWSSSSSGEHDGLGLHMDEVHLREHLQSRHKLYAKIEQLYNVRGHNGSACVLRALCENGQRQQEHQRRRRHTEPQTFIAELLRAIFTLPKDIHLHTHGKRSSTTYIAAHYTEAHEHAGNCWQRFAACEHSIWRADAELKI